MQMGTCPVCNGTGRQPIPPGYERYRLILATYDVATHTLACRNCGGQTMEMVATGQVRLRTTGEPCLHEYRGVVAGRCYIVYTCEHCGDRYAIDSGD
jgi:hypothetical protein